MKKRNYSVNIVSDDPLSPTREFKISSKQIRHALLAFFLLIVTFGFIMFDYLITSFDKEKMKRLERALINKEKVIYELNKKVKDSFVSKEEEFNKKLSLLNELDKSIKSILKGISENRELSKLKKEISELEKKKKSIEYEIKKSKPLLDLKEKQIQRVAKETGKEIDKSYKKKIPIEFILGIITSLIATLLFIYVILPIVRSIKKKEKIKKS